MNVRVISAALEVYMKYSEFIAMREKLRERILAIIDNLNLPVVVKSREVLFQDTGVIVILSDIEDDEVAFITFTLNDETLQITKIEIDMV
jgi:hypothetical protein